MSSSLKLLLPLFDESLLIMHKFEIDLITVRNIFRNKKEDIRKCRCFYTTSQMLVKADDVL